MTTILQLPRLKSRHRGLECQFIYTGRSWTLRRSAESLGDDALIQYALYLEGRELDPFGLLGDARWQQWRQLPYQVPHAQLCPGNVPSPTLCGWVATLLDAYDRHPEKRTCFWPLAA